MGIERTLIREVLTWLWNHSERPWTYKQRQAKLIYGSLEFVYPSLQSREDLERLLPTDDRSQGEFDRYFYLPPIETGKLLQPIMSLKYDFERSHPEIRCRVVLFLWHENKPTGFGLRFETPEGEGRHHFYHMQLIRSLKIGQSIEGCPLWLPDWEPTLPLDADDPVKLIICMLVALYGVTYLTKLGREDFWPAMKERINDMMSQKFQPTFWMVTNAAKQQYIKTWDEERRFKQIMKAKGATNIVKIDPQIWFDRPPDQRLRH